MPLAREARQCGAERGDRAWARHGTGHTVGFDQTVAWLATMCAKSAVTELMRIAWRTVGAVVARVWADTQVLRGLAGRTVREALDAGEDPKVVWRVVHATLELPLRDR